MAPEVEHVLVKVARRQGLRSFGRSAFFWTVLLAAVYALALIGARLLSLWPDGFAPWTVAVVPLLAGGIAYLVHPRSNLAGAARAADLHQGTEDLFLTSLEGDRAPGAYQPLVVESAATAAQQVKVDAVAPLPFGGRAAQIVIALGLLWLAAMFLPSLDPFRTKEQEVLLGRQRERLTEEEKATEQRKEALRAKKIDSTNSAEVERAVQDVMKTFREMQPKRRVENDQRLKKAQAEVGVQWREARAKSQGQGGRASQLQSMGRLGDAEKVATWRKNLSQGKTDVLRRELSELQETLKKLAASTDEKEREELRKKLQERAKDLAEFLKSNASSEALNNSLAKALNQLQAMANPELAKQAEKALAQSFELSAMELKNLAQSLRDMKSLEQALEALQKARQANGKGGAKGDGKGEGKGEGAGSEPGLDGDGMPDMDSLEEYREYYERLLADGQGPGEGMGGPGKGEGGLAPEDDSQKNAFRTEKSRSALRAGKLLLTLKTKEAGDKGAVEEEYATTLEKVKQGVSEAILQERVPPGYHRGIQKYFDSLGREELKQRGELPGQPGPSKSPKKK